MKSMTDGSTRTSIGKANPIPIVTSLVPALNAFAVALHIVRFRSAFAFNSQARRCSSSIFAASAGMPFEICKYCLLGQKKIQYLN